MAKSSPAWRAAKLWPHQVKAIESVITYFQSGADGAALVRMPTGTGKTGVMAVLAQLVSELPNVLIVAPWAQLTGQLAREIQAEFWRKTGVASVTKQVATFTPASLAGVLSATPSPGVLICTNQSLERLHSDHPDLYRRLKAWATVALIDEGHREPAPRWATAVRQLDKPRVLFSATPYRNDHRLFQVDPNHVYRFPHAQAVNERFIREVAFHETDWGTSPADFVTALRKFVRTQVLPDPPRGFPRPRVIVRCATNEDVETVTRELERLGEDVVGIHETFDAASDEILVRHVPDFATSTARYWVHQFKLLEGVDDPSFCVAAIFQPFGTARALVQQIGRIVRNPQRTANQTALVFASPRHRQRAMWEAYLAFENQSDAAIPLDPKEALAHVLQATDRLEYLDGNYRAPFDTGVPDLHTQFRFPLAANIFVVDAGFSVADLAEDIRELLDEEDLVISGESSPDRHTRFMAYARFRSSELLLDRAFPELSLGFCVARKAGPYLFYYDSFGLTPEPLRELERVGPHHLERLLAGSRTRISAVSLLNSDLANYSVRRRSLSARSIEVLAPGLADHTHFCSTASGVVDGSSGALTRRYVGFTRSRVSEHSGNGVEYDAFANWTDRLSAALDDSARTPPDVFSRYALFVKQVKKPEPTHILFDFDEIEVSELGQEQGKGGKPTPVRFDDLCWDVAPDGSFDITDGNRKFTAKVAFEQTEGRYSIISKDLDSVIALPNGSRESGRKLLALLNQSQAFRIVTGDGHIYAHGSFYRTRVPLWGRNRRDRIDLESILEPCQSLLSITSEKGGAGTAGATGWGTGSLFALIDDQGAQGLFRQQAFGPDYLVCDDLGNELADFIAFSENPRRVVLVHAKVDGKNSRVSASAFQEVCGQAVKNLDLLVPQCDREPKNLVQFSRQWRHATIGTVQSRTRVNRFNLTPRKAWDRLQLLVRHPDTQREVWIVLGNGLSLAAFHAEREKDHPRGQVIQLIYLLQSTWNSVSSTGAKLRVFVRP